MATKSICNIDGCDKPAEKRGWCNAHYKRWKRHGDPLAGGVFRERQGGQCAAPECGNEAKTKGLCYEHYWRQKNRGTFERVNGVYPSSGKCRVEGCFHIGPLKVGMCAGHYLRQWRHGDATAGGTMNGALLRWLQDHVSYEGDECLDWPFTKSPNGYGMASFNGVRSNASRVMCFLAHGEPPTPKHEAAHSCGKGHEGCTNPRHLSWKTSAENSADAVAHGTWKHGEMDPRAKLTEGDVRMIRSMSASRTQSEIADMFGVDQGHVSNIIKRKAWAWLI